MVFSTSWPTICHPLWGDNILWYPETQRTFRQVFEWFWMDNGHVLFWHLRWSKLWYPRQFAQNQSIHWVRWDQLCLTTDGGFELLWLLFNGMAYLCVIWQRLHMVKIFYAALFGGVETVLYYALCNGMVYLLSKKHANVEDLLKTIALVSKIYNYIYIYTCTKWDQALLNAYGTFPTT